MEVSSSGTFTVINHRKQKATCKWNGSIKPTKNKTVRGRMNLRVNHDRLVVDVNASLNDDRTMNVVGDVTTTQGKKTLKKHIDLKHYKVNKKMLTPKILVR